MRFSQRLAFDTPANRLELLKRELALEGRGIIDASASNPTKAGLSPEFSAISRAFSKFDASSYRPDPRGLIEARELLAKHFSLPGHMLDPGRFSLCASTSEAYSYLFKLFCDPGDAILVPKPGYPLFDHLAALEAVRPLGYRSFYNKSEGWAIDLDSLERLADSGEGRKIRLLVAIHPNNPTGAYLSEADRRGILAFCSARSIPLVVDEVFFGYSLDERHAPRSFLEVSDVPVFVLDGLSKRLCLPQAKLGWIYAAGPSGQAHQSLSSLDIISDAFLSAGTPVMKALPALLEMEESVHASVMARTRGNLDYLKTVLEYEGSPHELLRCEGGWTALVRSPRYDSEEEMAMELLREACISIQPGYFFDMETEAYFAFSLILDDVSMRNAAEGYREFFARHGA